MEVVGSGSAGATAASAAARSRAGTLVVEKLPFLGGTSTAVLDTFCGFYTPGAQPHKAVSGIGDEVVDELCRLGRAVERPNTYGAGRGITYLAEHLKVAWERLVLDAGAQVLLHAFVQDAVLDDSGVSELVVATKAASSGWARAGPDAHHHLAHGERRCRGARGDQPRREGSDHSTPVEGMTATIMTRVEQVRWRHERLVNAINPEVLTQA